MARTTTISIPTMPATGCWPMPWHGRSAVTTCSLTPTRPVPCSSWFPDMARGFELLSLSGNDAELIATGVLHHPPVPDLFAPSGAQPLETANFRLHVATI